MAQVDKELVEIIDYTEVTTGRTVSTHGDLSKDDNSATSPYIDIERKPANLHSELSSLTTIDSMISTSESVMGSNKTLQDVLFDASEDGSQPDEQKQRICVKADFGKNVARIVNQPCPVRFVGDEEVCFLDVDTMTQALETLMEERNEFINETLDLMQATKAAANLASDLIEVDDVMEC